MNGIGYCSSPKGKFLLHTDTGTNYSLVVNMNSYVLFTLVTAFCCIPNLVVPFSPDHPALTPSQYGLKTLALALENSSRLAGFEYY